MATEARKRRGFKGPCPMCGEEDTTYVDIDDCTVLKCHDCDGEMTTAQLRGYIVTWLNLADWLDSAPPLG
jgi:hypothetical protein